MSFNTALSGGNYTSLRSNYAAAQYLCLWPNPIVFKSTLSATPTGNSFAAVTFGSTITGDSADVEAGMRVVIGPDDDLQDAISRAISNNDAFDGRARGAVAGSSLPINETSANISSGDYVWVIRDYPVLDKLARESGGSYFKDWNVTFSQPAPIIGNLQTAYAGICSGSPEALSVSFAPTAIAGTHGASITSWTWTIPTGGTITAGSSSTQNITVSFDAGTYDVRLVVSDGTRSTTRHIYVFAVPSNMSSVVALGFSGAEIEADVENGWTARVNAFAGVSGVLDNTLAVIFDDARYGASAATIGGNIRMVGRLRTETNRADTDSEASLNLETAFDIDGAAAQLGRLAGPVLSITDKASPTRWDQITRATWWRVLAHLLDTHSTFLLTHSLKFGETSDNYRLPIWGVNGGDLLSEVNNTAGSIGASAEFAPDGRMICAQRAGQISPASRDALTTVAAWTNQDYVDLSIERELAQSVGLVESAGGTMNTTTGKVAAYLSQAPGTAWTSAAGRGRMPGQALAINQNKAAAEAELNTRTGYYFAEQNPVTRLQVTHPAGYGWMIPSRAQWYTWTLGADDNLRGLVYTTSERWLLTQISIRHDNDTGSQEVECTYEREVIGATGETVPPQPQTSISNPLPAIPPIIGIPDLGFTWDPIIGTNPEVTPPFWREPSLPGGGGGVTPDGNTVVVCSPSGVWATQNFKTAQPAWAEVTPDLTSGFTIRDGEFGFDSEYYLLSSDSRNSTIYYTEDVFNSPVAWVENATLAGEYTSIRPGSTAGTAYVYGRGVFASNKYIAVWQDSSIYVTTDFDTPSSSGGPTWTQAFSYVSSSFGAYRDFVVDPFSPGYVGSGTEVNGWLMTTLRIGYVEDIFGTPSITWQHTFGTAAGAGTGHGRIVASNGLADWVVAVRYFNNANGTIASYTTDGGANWSDVTINTFRFSGVSSAGPSVHVSSRTDGTVYTSAYVNTAGAYGSALVRRFVSTDYGANWAEDTEDLETLHIPHSALHMPHDVVDEDVVFWTDNIDVGGGFGTSPRLMRNDAGTDTDISPLIAAVPYGPIRTVSADFPQSLDTVRTNANTLIMSGQETIGTASNGLFITRNALDATPTWTTLEAPTVYGNVYAISDNVFYLTGNAGAVGFTDGVTIDSRTGDLPTSSNARALIVGLT